MDPSELNWSDEIWKGINDDALKEVGKVRIAQKVFPTSLIDKDPTQIANEVIDFSNMTVGEAGGGSERLQDAGANGGQGDRPG